VKSRLSRALWIALVVAVALPRYAVAQDDRRVELAGGYSLMRDYDGAATFPGGWFGSVAVDVAGPLALVGDASGSYKSMGGLDVNLSTTIHTFMGGRGSPGGAAGLPHMSRCCLAPRAFRRPIPCPLNASQMCVTTSRWRRGAVSTSRFRAVAPFVWVRTSA
jgi:hypothetical protein